MKFPGKTKERAGVLFKLCEYLTEFLEENLSCSVFESSVYSRNISLKIVLECSLNSDMFVQTISNPASKFYSW